MTGTPFRFTTLGNLSLSGPSEGIEGLVKRRRKLALLAVLALAKRPIARHLLVDLFWGEEPEERARHSLSDALSHLRRVLGREILVSTGNEITLVPNGTLAIDALELAQAAERGDSALVLELYRGPFLDGVYVAQSPGFEQWLARERSRLERLFLSACDARCATLAESGAWYECAAIAERWLEAAPDSAEAGLHLLNAMRAPGTAASLRSALDGYEILARRMRADYEQEPDERLQELARQIQHALVAQLARGERESPGPVIVAEPEVRHQEAALLLPDSTRPDVVARTSRVSRSWRVRAGIAVSAAILVGIFVMTRGSRAEPIPAIPVVAITRVESLGADSGSWLAEGFRAMVSAALARSGAVEIIAPERIRDVATRAGYVAKSVTDDEALQLAQRVHATWSITASVNGDGTNHVLEIHVRDAVTGTTVGLFTAAGNNPVAVADEAASKVRALANSSAPGPHLADVETPDPEAYRHFVRAQQAFSEGRYEESNAELDAAIARDSGFTSAILMRLHETNNDQRLVDRLKPALARASSRLTEWDRLDQAMHTAMWSGDHLRAEQLARDLTHRYPHDPRGYALLGDVLTLHGKWASADSVLRQALALDSLAAAAGSGPCAPCTAYAGLTNLRLTSGDLAGAEQVARRWIAVQPEEPYPWTTLSSILLFEGQYAEGLGAAQRTVSLSHTDGVYGEFLVRALLMARRYGEADSAIARMIATAGPSRRQTADGLELRSVLQRERGQRRDADRSMAAALRIFDGDLAIVRAHALGRMGETVESHRRFAALSPQLPLDLSAVGVNARAYTWHRVLEADAMASAEDTVHLRAMADTIASISGQSYYGRDWNLHHHVRGLVAMRGARYEEAIREFSAARWGKGGFTRTNIEIATAELALGRPVRAIAVLRDAYKAPLDAMGSYTSRADIDFNMALAFSRAGQADSAKVYGDYVRVAWANADSDVRARLAQLR